MDIKDYLQNLGINFRTISHPAVFTVEQAEKTRIDVKGPHAKNLFLKDRKSRRFYLAILPGNKRADMKDLGMKVTGELKFASEQDLKEILGLTPGSVSPFGLINDKEHNVHVLIDKEVWDADFVSFHPNINTETLELTGVDFHRYIESLKNKTTII